MSKRLEKEMQRWVERWKITGPLLRRIRSEESKSADIASTVALLDDAFQSALKLNPARPTSGLIEQQRWFMRLKL